MGKMSFLEKKRQQERKENKEKQRCSEEAQLNSHWWTDEHVPSTGLTVGWHVRGAAAVAVAGLGSFDVQVQQLHLAAR